MDHADAHATLELIEAHAHAAGRAARLTYLGILGGPDLALALDDDVALIAHGNVLTAHAGSWKGAEAARTLLGTLDVRLPERRAIVDDLIEQLGALRQLSNRAKQLPGPAATSDSSWVANGLDACGDCASGFDLGSAACDLLTAVDCDVGCL